MSDLSDWTAFGKMQADYVTALATYGKEQANAVKTLADAEKTEAEAAILREKFDAINLVLDSLQKFLRREGKKWRKLDEDNAKIAKDALNVGTLNSGSSRKTADAIKS